MAAVIIRKTDLDKLAHDLLKEIYDFLHDEYILTTFEEMKILQERFLRTLVYKYFRKNNSTVLKSKYKMKFEYKEYDESKFEEDVKRLKSKIEDKSIDTEVIFMVLNDIRLDMEIDEDLYCKHLSFLDIYKVYETGYTYLED